jgi:hypothetical protein
MIFAFIHFKKTNWYHLYFSFINLEYRCYLAYNIFKIVISLLIWYYPEQIGKIYSSIFLNLKMIKMKGLISYFYESNFF